MAHITFRLSATWSEKLLHRLDLALEQLERAARDLLTERSGDFHEEVHAAQLRRLAARGSSGQALI